MSEMIKKPEQKIRVDEVQIDLPRKTYSALSHLANIEYCINQIRRYSKRVENPVVGYVLERGLGNREAHHRILSQENAEDLKLRNSRFDYMTLEDFIKEKDDIKQGKYIMNNGLIIDFANSYSR